MLEVRKTKQFARWMDRLRDTRARARILVRLKRLSLGHFGDSRSVGHRVSELKIDYGPGYRVYFTKRADAIVILLIGGTKKTQSQDIKKAIAMAREQL